MTVDQIVKAFGDVRYTYCDKTDQMEIHKDGKCVMCQVTEHRPLV